MSEDPIELFGGLNMYAYVGNNPLIFVDPLGLTQMNFNVDYYNDHSWGWGEGQFHVDLPPAMYFTCKCIGKNQYKLEFTITWFIRIYYGSPRQLRHENGHLDIITNYFNSRVKSYEEKFEKTYSTSAECENDGWRMRDQFRTQLQNDYQAQGKFQSAHDDWFQNLWQWWPWSK